ncbi:MAG TPA: hypothetical protein PK637_02550 [Flavobacteriales bacterium]|nr:hypothetical protein [Flavobacteriales bacterium]HRE95614.1 hypothetical protein [Flavobacteriales bacterium]HRJ35091.1 hypothetical protein [Flavobacteriales bacterium]HRJ38538.1 hypothetical protein [Flavobacteriales bacterium]
MERLNKKIIFFLIMMFVPFTFFYLFSRGSQHFKRLPFFGTYSADSVPFSYPDFSFTSSTGVISKENLKGKIIIMTAMGSDCPDNCDFLVKPFRLDVYNGILKKNKEFKDVIILSEMVDTIHTRLEDMPEKLKVDAQQWNFFVSENKLFWDVELNGNSILRTDDKDRPGKMMWTRSILLIDPDFRLRGWYDGVHGVELRRLIDELRLLKKELNDEE